MQKRLPTSLAASTASRVLLHAPHTGEREQPRVPPREQPPHVFEFAPAAHQRG